MPVKMMFEKTSLTLLISARAGYKEVSVYEMEGELYFQHSGYYLRIKQQGMTTNQNLNWVRFSNGKVPTYNMIGFAQAGGRWQKEPARTQLKPKPKSSVTGSTSVRKVLK